MDSKEEVESKQWEAKDAKDAKDKDDKDYKDDMSYNDNIDSPPKIEITKICKQ